MSNATPLPPEPFQLNTAQESGIAGVEEQLTRSYALVASAVDHLKGLPDNMTKEDMAQALTLLGMAEEELGDHNCLARIRDGRFR